MAKKIILDREIVEDSYQELADTEPVPSSSPTPSQVIVSFARFVKEAEPLLAQAGAVGIRLPSDKLPSDVPSLDRLSLIAIEFPRFSDGRGYSIAKLLRERFGFRGQLRAVGWVLRDNLLYMERVGFNAFELAPGKPLESGLEAFRELPIAYQATALDHRPLYRRRV
jgi:uncharacterized protein (DUF934 family)